MTRIFYADRWNTAHPQLIMENDIMSITVLPELGGRILDIQREDMTFLHRKYPQSVHFGTYVEHGGIEECIGKAPGTLWNTPWRVKEMQNGVILSTTSSTAFSKILIQKHIILDDVEPILQIKYDFINIDTKFNKFTFGIHPELCLGDNFKENEYHVPTEEGMLEGKFQEIGFKKFVTPGAGWCAATYNGIAFAQLFPQNVIDCFEIYYPRVGTHFVLQPLIWGAGLSPNRKASFTSIMYAGEGDVQTIQDLYERKQDTLVSSYEKIEPPAERIFTEREELFIQRRPQITMPIDEFGQLPRRRLRDDFLEQAVVDEQFEIEENIPVPQINPLQEERVLQAETAHAVHEVTAEIESLLEGTRITRAQRARQLPEVQKTRKHLEIAREQVSFPADEITAIFLSSIAGSIRMQAWEEPKIDVDITRQLESNNEEQAKEIPNNTRPEITQDDKNLIIRSIGGDDNHVVNYALRMPQRLNSIELDFVDSNVLISDLLPTHLKINGLSGKIEINGGITENSIYEVKSVSGDITLQLHPNANCSITATSAMGAIECDVELTDCELLPKRISGVFNANNAQINVNTIRGTIRITRIKEQESKDTNLPSAGEQRRRYG